MGRPGLSMDEGRVHSFTSDDKLYEAAGYLATAMELKPAAKTITFQRKRNNKKVSKSHF